MGRGRGDENDKVSLCGVASALIQHCFSIMLQPNNVAMRSNSHIDGDLIDFMLTIGGLNVLFLLEISYKF